MLENNTIPAELYRPMAPVLARPGAVLCIHILDGGFELSG